MSVECQWVRFLKKLSSTAIISNMYLTYKTTKISYLIIFSNSKCSIVLNEFRIEIILKHRYSNRQFLNIIRCKEPFLHQTMIGYVDFDLIQNKIDFF